MIQECLVLGKRPVCSSVKVAVRVRRIWNRRQRKQGRRVCVYQSRQALRALAPSRQSGIHAGLRVAGYCRCDPNVLIGLPAFREHWNRSAPRQPVRPHESKDRRPGR